ncbi:CYTH domain-containing protein [Ureibacillus composti]|nr:CYTH domain-containing protein [Ureibacillus composti]
MSQEIEIEFKNNLTKKQYEELLSSFHIADEMILRQTNHYFDTPTWHLKNQASGLRIRETKEKIVCTLKEKTSKHTHLETTDVLTKEQADSMLNGNAFLAPTVKEKLIQIKVPIDQLAVFGTLTTDRVEVPYMGGTLVFDHSFYLNRDDYEVEYEANDEKIGAQIFEEFLKKFNIEKQIADKKIARFMQALNAER